MMVGALIVTGVVVILTTLLLVIVTKVFSRSRSGDGGGAVPVIPDITSSSIITAPLSSPTSRSWKYDVFLSFRGEDTRKTFVDHLYSALFQHGILTYKDDVTLDRGDTIGPSLLSAIQESQIALIVFSKNYADSSWCLDELSYIMKCKEEMGQIVMPIFYDVDPSDVRKQKGQFGKAFAKHKLSKNNKIKVESWKQALVNSSNIAGWESKYVANGHEAKCVQEIVDSILDKLSSLDPVVDDENLVGMRTRLKDLKSRLRIESSEVRMVGIWGVGGGGKTTLATSLFMELCATFDGSCFLGNIREVSKQQNGLQSLQEKILSTVFDKKLEVQSVDIGKHMIKRMLCRRNVLIVLDDVDRLDQLAALAGGHNWFGTGSRIIITTRNEQLLVSHRVDEVCPVSLLSHDEAIRLFKIHAYHEHDPLVDYQELSLRVISYVDGLPLALKILGSFLYGKNKDEWHSTLARLKDHPDMDILEKLKISYDGLQPVEKELFLDIACFHMRKSKEDAMEMLDACGFHPRIGVKVLIQKALIFISSDGYSFEMHDLVQEMGHYIIRGEHPDNPEKHSRVWRNEDVKDMCFRNATMENDKIEAIDCYDHLHQLSSSMFLSNMKKLRLLTLRTRNCHDEGPSFLSNDLKYIHWESYPGSLFPESFQPTKLVVLKMERSLQKELWKGYKHLPCLKELELVDASELVRIPDIGGLTSLQKLKLWRCERLEEIHQSHGNHCLKELQLSHMNALVRTPDFGGLPCLQKLILSHCGRLEEIHQSLETSTSLIYLSVKECRKLKRFPSIARMQKLENLKISECKALIEFPKIEAKMENLVKLKLKWIGIEVLPSSVGEYCTNLISLALRGCENLKSIEGNFKALKGLKMFELCDCKKFEKLPTDLFNENLDELRLLLKWISGSIKRPILFNLPRVLSKLNLGECQLEDGEMPDEIGELSNLQELNLSWNNFTRLDLSFSKLNRLKNLDLTGCIALVELPELPSSLAIVKADVCLSLESIIRDEFHTNCKWLSQVSIIQGGNVIGGERILETMLQGNSVEGECMRLQLQGLDVARGFEPRLVKGTRCRMQLPENWYKEFSGFLFCIASNLVAPPMISMKHRKLEGGSTGMKVSNDDIFWEESDDCGGGMDMTNIFDTLVGGSREQSKEDDAKSKGTWVGYIPFGSLRNTLWWNPRSTAIDIEFDPLQSNITIGGCGIKLIPRRSETSITQSSSDDVPNDYTCRLNILRDSESTYKFYIGLDEELDE